MGDDPDVPLADPAFGLRISGLAFQKALVDVGYLGSVRLGATYAQVAEEMARVQPGSRKDLEWATKIAERALEESRALRVQQVQDALKEQRKGERQDFNLEPEEFQTSEDIDQPSGFVLSTPPTPSVPGVAAAFSLAQGLSPGFTAGWTDTFNLTLHPGDVATGIGAVPGAGNTATGVPTDAAGGNLSEGGTGVQGP